MDYKKIIKSQKLRFAILHLLSWVPDRIMILLQYRIKMGFWPELKHPKRFTEKLQVYKLKYRNPLMHQCVDKYEVRSYVKSKGLGHILNELYGIYDTVDDIDLESLPPQFVAKNTNGSGGQDVMIVREKSGVSSKTLAEFFQLRMGKNVACLSREWAYSGIKKSRVIVEKLLESNNADGSIEDFKFFCFKGKFRAMCVDRNRYSDHHRGFWDENLHFLKEVSSDHDTFSEIYPLPDNINEMIRYAETLSEDFPFVRVDLYNINGMIVFGELTFYPWGGYVIFKPESFDYHLGEYFTEYY